MKKRFEVSLIDNGSKVQLRGVDETRNDFHLFKQVKVTGTTQDETAATTTKVYPAESGPNAEQPYKFALPAANARTDAFYVKLQSIGHYNEKIVKLTVNMQELTQHQTITYEMIMD